MQSWEQYQNFVRFFCLYFGNLFLRVTQRDRHKYPGLGRNTACLAGLVPAFFCAVIAKWPQLGDRYLWWCRRLTAVKSEVRPLLQQYALMAKQGRAVADPD